MTLGEKVARGAHASSLEHLLARLAVIEHRVRTVVQRLRHDDPNPDDAFRGLYLTPDDIDQLLRGPRDLGVADIELDGLTRAADDIERTAAAETGPTRLRFLADAFDLDEIDLDLLLVALAPDLDPRYERFFGYLHDDVTRRRASIGLAIELVGASAVSDDARGRFLPTSALVDGGLLVIEEGDRPFLARSLRVPDRVAAFLLGDDTPDPSMRSLVDLVVPTWIQPAATLVRALEHGCSFFYVRERPGSSATSFATSALASTGRRSLVLDVGRLSPGESPIPLFEDAVREARLQGAGLVVGPIELLTDSGSLALRRLSEARCPLMLFGRSTWDPAWSTDAPVLIAAESLGPDLRVALWETTLGADAAAVPDAARTLRMDPEQVRRAAQVARSLAVINGSAVSADHVRAGALAQNSAGLERLARRVEPKATWDDLVLPEDVIVGLRDLGLRVRHRDRVLGDWKLRRDGWRGDGAAALFAGPSGTGKTLAAEVMAYDIGVDLYIIDLASVVDKYIGETEKNLDRIFEQAERVQGVLLFDEADALFGKRSDVKDARDRYANVEIAYLLQRMETFDGIAVLTTNLRANIDEAFTRRLDVIVDFAMPDPEYRHRLWDHLMGTGVPRSGDVDLTFLAERFELAGGNIRNVIVSAAFLAAEEGTDLTMRHLILGTGREYRKMGRLCLESEFGEYHRLLSSGEGGF